jgi:hypothetical protein
MAMRTYTSLAALALVLAACGGDKNKQAGANEVDPAVANALEDQIMVDPNLAAQSNRFSARDTNNNLQAPMPATGKGGPPAPHVGKLMRAPEPVSANGGGGVTLGQLAKEQSAKRRDAKATPDCDKNFQYSMGWATKLPEGFSLYPDAQVTEAAGNNSAPCRMRLISFASKAPLQTLIDFYYTQAVRSGFNAEHQLSDGEHILAGAREKDDGAYYLVFNARKDGGTDVDMILNHGR